MSHTRAQLCVIQAKFSMLEKKSIFLLIAFDSPLYRRDSHRPVGGSVCFTQQGLALAITGHTVLHAAGETKDCCGLHAKMAT